MHCLQLVDALTGTHGDVGGRRHWGSNSHSVLKYRVCCISEILAILTRHLYGSDWIRRLTRL